MTSAVTKRAKFVYIVEWILITLSLLSFIATVVFYSVQFNKFIDDVVARDPSIRREDAAAVLRISLIVSGVIGGIWVLIEIGMTVLLTKGVQGRNHKYCKIWFIVQCVFFSLTCIGLVFDVVRSSKGYEYVWVLIGYGIASVLYIIYRIVTLIFIKSLMTEIAEENSRTGRYAPVKPRS